MLIGEHTAPADLIKDTTDATFMADVVEASKQQPVIVDFWAPWCGPCRQLGPVLERAVTAAGGKVKLVKVDIDANPAFAGQLRVQSIPAVFAFKDGKPVDGFMGALPESQVKAFIAKLTDGEADDDEIEPMLAMAAEALANEDVGAAAQFYAAILQADPANPKAIAGMARCFLAGGETERAAAVLKMAGEAPDPDLDAARAALKIAENATGELAPLKARIDADPGDFVARVDLARLLAAQGRFQDAADQLFVIVEKDRDWNGGQARGVLLEVFEAAGHASEAARSGRRRLSSILFA